MNKLTAALVLTLMFSLVSIVGCHREHPVPGRPGGNLPPIDIFTVDANNCDVSARVANAYRHLNHRITWLSQDHKPYTVVFRPDDGTPGSGSPFTDAQNNPIYNFAVRSTTPTTTPVPTKSGYFEYGIKDQNNNQCKDPKDPGLNVKD
jgi:hypothetical protein